MYRMQTGINNNSKREEKENGVEAKDREPSMFKCEPSVNTN